MATKVGNLIGGKIATTFWFSCNTNTRASLCASNTTSTCTAANALTQDRRKHYLCIATPHIFRPSSPPLVQATPRPSGPNSNEPNSSFPSTFQDNLKYLLMLAVSSFLGAAVIKYGSAAVPAITKPDITVALLMISTPSIIAVLLLAKESRKD